MRQSNKLDIIIEYKEEVGVKFDDALKFFLKFTDTVDKSYLSD